MLGLKTFFSLLPHSVTILEYMTNVGAENQTQVLWRISQLTR